MFSFTELMQHCVLLHREYPLIAYYLFANLNESEPNGAII